MVYILWIGEPVLPKQVVKNPPRPGQGILIISASRPWLTKAIVPAASSPLFCASLEVSIVNTSFPLLHCTAEVWKLRILLRLWNIYHKETLLDLTESETPK